MRHVLLVEDNPLNQALVEDIFRYDNLPGELVCVESARRRCGFCLRSSRWWC